MAKNDEHIITMEQLQHEHSLELVDLLPNYPQYEEYVEEDEENDDDGDDDYTKWEFCSNLCGREINLYQRYYYKCSHTSCDYALHKCCREIPKTLDHKSHRCLNDTFVLCNSPPYNLMLSCVMCKTMHNPNETYYRCQTCRRTLHLKCVIISIENPIIYHPSHPHPLVSATYEPVLYGCDACGKKHLGNLFHCTTCYTFSIQSDCLFLSKKLNTPHIHPLILTYSFSKAHLSDEFFPRCRICNQGFENSENLWIYICEKCRYYIHLDCAKSKGDQFISGIQEMEKNYEDSDHPNILNLPFRDETDNLQKHLFFKENSTLKTNKDNIYHNFHQHPLHLVDTQPNDTINKTSICCHNPRKKIELLCDGCVKPITGVPYFYCKNEEDQSCRFVLHEWCNRLPPKVNNHPGHPQHTLLLLPKVPGSRYGVFDCGVCCFPSNGFAYGCQRCGYYIDVTCGFIPEEITHEAHPNHLFLRVKTPAILFKYCFACLYSCSFGSSFSYKCSTCDIYLHLRCALLLPKTIVHRYDKHPMNLSYMPIENHKAEYFCEICEEKFDPKKWFYHCYECLLSVHSNCFQLILKNESPGFTRYNTGVYGYSNIKFGRFLNI